VNYRHEYGVWFPYKNSRVAGYELAKIARNWREHPSKIKHNFGDPISQHIATCTLIVSICKLVVDDMHKMSTKGKSFHAFGAVSLNDLVAQYKT
jgi:hypothetical protein